MLIVKIPLKKSPTNAAQPSSTPKLRVTFDDPAKREPTSTMFNPLLLLMRWHIGIEPIQYPIIVTASNLTSKLMKFKSNKYL